MYYRIIIEIPTNSRIKYEIKNNKLYVDRIIKLKYLYNYGYFPNTLSGDGDPLDAMLILDDPLLPTSIIDVKIIGALLTTDENGRDEKIICVPLNSSIKNINEFRCITKR